MDSRKRDAWLDGLRAVAVLLVLGRHVEPPDAAAAWLSIWQRGGWVGVDLFFVLSGFLVSGLLFREYQRERQLSVGRFLVRRGLRIYPAFYALLLCTALLALILPFPRTSIAAYVAEALFFQNYHRAVWGHTWSLAVEEHFYLALPLLLLGLLRGRRGEVDPFRRLVGITASVAVAAVLARCITAYLLPYRNKTHLFATHLRVDALLAGVLLAYVYHFHRTAFARWVDGRRVGLFAAGVLCFVPAFVFEIQDTWLIYTFGLSLFACGGVLLIAAGVGAAAPLPARLLAPLGAISYSTYLWHMAVLMWGVPLAEQLVGYRLFAPLRIALYMAGSVLVGALMAWATELPILRLRERWFPSASERPIEADGAARRAA